MSPPGRPDLWRPAPCFGAGLLLFGLVLLTSACAGGSSEGSSDEGVDPEALGLSGGAELHRITLGGRGSEEHAVPSIVRATAGDGVEFRTVDHRVHTVTFPLDSLAAEAAAFLVSTGQTLSPPLATRGSRFILRLEGAPPGRYPFVTEGHGGSAHGVVEVVPPGGPGSPESGGS